MACEECRAKRSRCDGIRPTCQSCTFRGIPCNYEATKAKVSVTKQYFNLESVRSKLMVIRYVDELLQRINLLESQLNTKKTLGDEADGGSLLNRRLSDHSRDHSSAAAPSALARVPAPTIPFEDSATPPSLDAEPTSLAIVNRGHTDGNETYEWDEGGDEKELSADAMGAAFKGDCRPGFFGTHQ